MPGHGTEALGCARVPCPPKGWQQAAWPHWPTLALLPHGSWLPMSLGPIAGAEAAQ